MQREIDNLQRQARRGWSQGESNESPALVSVEEPESTILPGPSASIGLDQSAPLPLLSPVTFTSPQDSTLESLKNAHLGPNDSVASNQHFTATLPRILDGFELEGFKIDDCFALFFEHYYPYLPAVQQGHSPNQYYTYSPVLFWTIIAIGSRRYEDPTIMQALAQRVSSIVLHSLPRISQHIPTIQSLLLLCAWPFPMETVFNDPSIVYAGAAMQLAIQNGLHMFSRRQDFSRVKLGDDQAQEVFRAELWGWCKIVCQSTSFCSGLEPYDISDAFCSELQWQKIITQLSPNLYWAQKLHKILLNAVTTLMGHSAIISHEKANAPIGAVVEIFDGQVQEMSRQSVNKINSLRITLSRLHIRAFQLFQDSENARDTKLLELHHIACSFIETISVADCIDDFGLYTSEMVYWTLMLAACVILRIYRSDLRHRTDLSIGERCYFSVIHLMKKRSLQNNDLGSRGSTILTQLWQSRQVFQQQDGTFNPLYVRIRCRGSMGVVYDCHWYWRREFPGQSDPYTDQSGKELGYQPPGTHISWPINDAASEDRDVVLSGVTDPMYTSDQNGEHLFRSWDWPADDFLVSGTV